MGIETVWNYNLVELSTKNDLKYFNTELGREKSKGKLQLPSCTWGQFVNYHLILWKLSLNLLAILNRHIFYPN